jgi:hypothetical protein
MSTTKHKALANAVSILNAIGAEYKIFFEDYLYGDLELDQVVLTKPEMSESSKLRMANYGKFKPLYYPVVAAMKVGDVATISFADIDALGAKREKMRTLALGAAQKLYGRGSLMTAFNDTGLEMLRLK